MTGAMAEAATARMEAAVAEAYGIYQSDHGLTDTWELTRRMVEAALRAADAVLPPLPVRACAIQDDHFAHRVPMMISCAGVGDQQCNDALGHRGAFTSVPFTAGAEFRCDTCGAHVSRQVAGR